MPAPNATLATGSAHSRRLSRAKNSEMNDNFVLAADANANRKPAYFIYVFNVSNRDIKIDRPWAHPSVILKATPSGAEYGPPFVLEDIKQETVDRAGSWEMGTRGVRGEFLAQDLLNPDRMWVPNQSNEPYWKTESPGSVVDSGNEGTNLYAFGCFWDTQNPPSPEAVLKARARLEGTYNGLVENANLLALQGASGLRQIGPLHRIAANYLGVETEWNRIMRGKHTCPGCGDMVPTGINRHMPKDKCGYVFDWDKALAGGQATTKEAIDAGVMEPPKK